MKDQIRTIRGRRRILTVLLCFLLTFGSFQIAVPGNAYAAELTLQPHFKNLSSSEKTTLRGIINTETAGCTTRLEKILAIHDWMVKNIRYDTSFKQHTASETLRNRIAVCSGYAALFWNFMNELGVPCEIICGVAGPNSESHAWNQVKMDDGKWYFVDVTWDDPLMNGTADYPGGENLVYKYFLVGSDNYKDHVARTSYNTASTTDLDLQGLAHRPGWNKEGSKWKYYRSSDYYLRNTWLTVNDEERKYFLDYDGYMVTGWYQIGINWYYFSGSGILQTGWKKTGGKWYYLDPVSGKMATGWVKIGNRWYFLEKSGAMHIGWLEYWGDWYFFDGSGKMCLGWKEIKGRWFYFMGGGVMATGTKRIGGKTYTFDSNGVWVD